MDKSLIIFLLLILILACSSYYAGFMIPNALFKSKSQASFIMLAFVIAPSLILVLWLQSGAQSRLNETGFVPLPSIQNCVGVTVGIGDKPIWMFETTQEKNRILDFYRDRKNRIGWNLISDDGSTMLVFRKENKKMTVSAGEGGSINTLSFSLKKIK